MAYEHRRQSAAKADRQPIRGSKRKEDCGVFSFFVGEKMDEKVTTKIAVRREY